MVNRFTVDKNNLPFLAFLVDFPHFLERHVVFLRYLEEAEQQRLVNTVVSLLKEENGNEIYNTPL
jgi:hypothetical protein